MRRPMLTALSLIVAAPLLAQSAPQMPGALDPARVQAGNYTVENHHAQILWTANHFGFNDYFGIFGQPTGTLSLDPKDPNAAKLSVTIPIADVATSRADLTKHLMGTDFFDVAKYPTATFVSTSVTASGNEAKITGDLTLLGVTKPIVLDAKFTGAGKNPFNMKETIGFHAKTKIKRSEWGMTRYIPLVSDDINIKISIAFEKTA